MVTQSTTLAAPSPELECDHDWNRATEHCAKCGISDTENIQRLVQAIEPADIRCLVQEFHLLPACADGLRQVPAEARRDLAKKYAAGGWHRKHVTPAPEPPKVERCAGCHGIFAKGETRINNGDELRCQSCHASWEYRRSAPTPAATEGKLTLKPLRQGQRWRAPRDPRRVEILAIGFGNAGQLVEYIERGPDHTGMKGACTEESFRQSFPLVDTEAEPPAKAAEPDKYEQHRLESPSEAAQRKLTDHLDVEHGRRARLVAHRRTLPVNSLPQSAAGLPTRRAQLSRLQEQ